jgi:phage gpG-like protein
MIRVGLQVDGLLQLKKKFEALGRENWSRSVLTPFGGRMQRSVAQVFREQKDPKTGAPWPKTSAGVLKSRPGGGKGGKSLSDTRALLNSIVSRPPRVTPASVSVGSNLIYALIHQKGGTIKAKKGKYLTIPVTREARRAGSIRAWFAANGKQARWLFGRKGIYGAGFAQKGKKGGKPVPHWILAKEIKVPQRRYLYFGQADREALTDMIQRRIQKVVKKG